MFLINGRLFASLLGNTLFEYLYKKLTINEKVSVCYPFCRQCFQQPHLKARRNTSPVPSARSLSSGRVPSSPGNLPLPFRPGTVDIVAGGLSPYIDPNSIQVKGEGDFMIMGVNHRNNYLENPAEAASIKDLRDKIEALEVKIENEKTAVDVLQEKELFLKSNYDVVTNKSAITPEQLKALMDLYSSNMESVKMALLKKKRIIKEYEEEKQQLENQLAGHMSTSRRLPTGEIVVTVTGTKASHREAEALVCCDECRLASLL